MIWMHFSGNIAHKYTIQNYTKVGHRNEEMISNEEDRTSSNPKSTIDH